MVALAPPPQALSLPANLSEVDGIIQDVAVDALLGLRNGTTVADEWLDDRTAQDDPPSSDDEEDVPLRAVVAAKQAPATVDVVPSPAISHRGVDGLDSFENGAPGSISPFASASASTLPSAVVVDYIPLIPLPRSYPPSPPPKQPLTAQPIIWAESRQEVCESFDWFRSYQGGVYYNNDMVKGYLLSAFSSSRDLFARDGRLIVSHGGGKAESLHSKKGQSEVQEADDQREEDKSVRALLRTYQMKRPVALIIDDKYALFPYDLAAKGYTYVVLGFYHIAHAWAERQPAANGRGHVVRYKFAFEWCTKQPEPWWIPAPAGAPRPDCPRAAASMFSCPSCGRLSPFVYAEARMCLQPNCMAFWSLLDGTEPPEQLTYDESFLTSSFLCDHETLEDIAPLPPATEAPDGVITSRRFCKGWHCKKCGRLSCRYKWEHWECQNCGATLQVSGKNRSPREFWGQSNSDFMHHKVSEDSGIIVSQLKMFKTGDRFSFYHVYILPKNRGRIYLILGSHQINQVANEIFEEYQEQARSGELRFRRWPLRMHQCRGALLTNYFSQNSTYSLSGSYRRPMRLSRLTSHFSQYVGGTANTVPFEGAPSAVVKARDLIQARMASVMQAESGQYCFNEVLSAAYMEKQKMAGDVLIMDGAEIQQYYEHTVVPLNFRIAATARHISAQ
ncbi:hypothetical protein BV20DRAFT_945550 [Pilatotrama ljubarskyi]|nr:hypothetical protein BV20DRAFT_945550 [Pilatotrama ljubarskyi]